MTSTNATGQLTAPPSMALPPHLCPNCKTVEMIKDPSGVFNLLHCPNCGTRRTGMQRK